VLQKLPVREQGSTIADLQARSGQYQEALKTLDRVLNEGISAATLIAKSRVLLELDRGELAAQVAKDAVSYEPDSTPARLQLGLCQIVAGDEAGYAATIASLNGVAAVETLKTAHAYKLALARELYAQGLLRTSERILNGLDDSSTERYLLQARIQLAFADVPAAQELLVRATKLDPANIEAHKLLEEVLLKLGDEAGADEQAGLIKSLQTGQL
jgi:tetratricopeptide (TPR) repeat protein